MSGQQKLKLPVIRASLVKLGSEMIRRQSTGEPVLFRAVKLTTYWTGVPSKLDGYASDWHSSERHWVPVNELEDGQVELERLV